MEHGLVFRHERRVHVGDARTHLGRQPCTHTCVVEGGTRCDDVRLDEELRHASEGALDGLRPKPGNPHTLPLSVLRAETPRELRTGSHAQRAVDPRQSGLDRLRGHKEGRWQPPGSSCPRPPAPRFAARWASARHATGHDRRSGRAPRGPAPRRVPHDVTESDVGYGVIGARSPDPDGRRPERRRCRKGRGGLPLRGERSLDLACYDLRLEDEAGRIVQEALTGAARRGVRHQDRLQRRPPGPDPRAAAARRARPPRSSRSGCRPGRSPAFPT